MLCLITLLAVAAPPAVTAPHRPRLLVMDFRNDGVEPKTVLIIRDALTAHLSRVTNVDVLSTEDLRRTLDVEAQKAAVGCTAEQCMAEIASALGADYIVFGNIGTLGGLLVGNMSLLDATKGTSVGRESIEVRTLEELPAAVRSAGTRLAAPIGVVAEAGGPFASPWLYAGAASVVVGVGAVAVGGALCSGAAGVIGDQVSVAAKKDQAVNDFNLYSGVAVGGGVLALAGAGVIAAAFLE